ncbi:MAG: serine/threonine-protein kinase, partial [Planctomycetaceae bacterium]
SESNSAGGEDVTKSFTAKVGAKDDPHESGSDSSRRKTKITRLGDFQIRRKLGQGGMGTVYLGRQISLDRPVALKTLSRDLANKPEAVQRFLREARAMAKLQHPNIVQVYAADSHAGFHFAALEYIDGQSMRDWMQQLTRLSVGDALHVALVTADALRHSHARNMVHRDVKPDNILVTKSGIVKISDFGLAKVVDEDVTLTQSGMGLGTPLYMSPEQARNAKHVDARSDLYSLGAVLYVFLTGQHAFEGASTLEIITAKEKGHFESARRRNPEIPERLDLMIDKLLAKNRSARYADCDELIRDLQSLELANPALSFIDGGHATVAAAVVGPAKTPTRAEHLAATMPAVPTPAPPAETQAEHRSQNWYVSFQSRDGKHHLKRMTTEQALEAIRKGLLDTKAKGKRGKDDALLPLAQFPEFVQQMDQLALRQRNRSKKVRMQELYDDVDRQDRRRRRWRWLRNLRDSALGGFGLVLWLAVIAAAGVGLYYLVPWVGNLIADKFNLR